MIPQELGSFYNFGQQSIPEGCRRPGERDPRDADWTTHPLAPFVNLCGVGVCHGPQPFKPRAQIFQFAALANTAHEGLPVNGYDGRQHPCDHVGQLAKRLLGRREETLEFSDGGFSLLALHTERLVAADALGTCSGSFLFDRGRERPSGKCLAFRLGLDEGRPLDVERLPGDPDCMLEPGMRGPGVKESLPEEAVALSRVLAVVPTPQVPDGSVWISGYPIDQGLGRAEGLSELLPDHDDVGDGWLGRTR